MRLHEGARGFHGTNPIAIGVPVEGERPWLFDMATSAVPFNRVHLYRSLGIELPPEVASDAAGNPTTDAAAAAMLAPLGGAFGYKGAGLAGLAEILSAALTGMRIGVELLPMGGPDISTPRGLGAFVLAREPFRLRGKKRLRRYDAPLCARRARRAGGGRRQSDGAGRPGMGGGGAAAGSPAFRSTRKRWRNSGRSPPVIKSPCPARNSGSAAHAWRRMLQFLDSGRRSR